MQVEGKPRFMSTRAHFGPPKSSHDRITLLSSCEDRRDSSSASFVSSLRSEGTGEDGRPETGTPQRHLLVIEVIN
ncbi:hypothetical protein JTE90_007132 [Oedothorax gibbosus]|uniref:Uncharacterized protein n=1 Tax=Oedothorax gibbosus TaxID=931172 RepID=A0AAV6VRP9_9ARAC|nr:hypothetical protein JTE90_007132 [Oedothorax gibbosus]